MAKKSLKRGKLHPVSFQKFVEEIYQDPKLKEEVERDLKVLGFCGFADKYFDLITRQKKELDTARERDAEAIFTDAVLLALHRGYPLKLVHEGHNPPNMKIDIWVGWDGGPRGGVTITC